MALFGCADPTGPDRGDPAQYVTSLGFFCSVWTLPASAPTLGLFDIVLQGHREGPSDAHVLRIVRLGGTIVHRFNVNQVRAILPFRSVPGLASIAFQVSGVPNALNTDLRLSIGFREAGGGGFIAQLGGQVRTTSAGGLAFSAVVPDAAVPTLRRDPRTTFIELPVIACVSGTTGERSSCPIRRQRHSPAMHTIR